MPMLSLLPNTPLYNLCPPHPLYLLSCAVSPLPRAPPYCLIYELLGYSSLGVHLGPSHFTLVLSLHLGSHQVPTGCSHVSCTL